MGTRDDSLGLEMGGGAMEHLVGERHRPIGPLGVVGLNAAGEAHLG